MKTMIAFDGACLGNPGPGGWAALIRTSAGERIVSNGEPNTTNNQMELLAAICGLETAEIGDIIMVGDSKYVIDGCTQWMPKWKSMGWARKGKAIANLDLWKALDAAIARHKSVSWQWTKGHAGHPDNERVDKIASNMAKSMKSKR